MQQGPIADYHDRQAWLEARRTGLGGSDISAIFGLNPWKTSRDVWLEKTGTPAEDLEGPDIRRGRRQEPIAAEVFTEVTGLSVRRQPLRRHPEHPFLLASIDRQVLRAGGHPGGPLEIKVPRTRTFYRWRREGLPDYVILQGQHEAGVWGAPISTFGIFNPENDEIMTPVVELQATVWNTIIERAGEWWETFVVGRREPPAEALLVPEKLPAVEGAIPVLRFDSDAFREQADEWMEARDVKKEAEQLGDDARDRLIAVAGDAVGVWEDEGGLYRFYYTKKPGRRSFDVAALEAVGAIDPDHLRNALPSYSLPPGEIEAIIGQCGLGLGRFWKVGAPFFELRGYRLRQGGE